MSVKHLAQGSTEPPRVQGLLRVYSMVICPYAKRTRLVLKDKNLPHDIVNIDLLNKPDWYFKLHPKGQVPTLLDGDTVIIESLDTADYLDEKYPTDHPLYPSDPEAKKRDRDFIRNAVSDAISSLSRVLISSTIGDTKETLKQLLAVAQPLEDELGKRGTKFFGGASRPGMVDYMLWPWAEFVPTLPKKLGREKVDLKDDQLPKLRQWVKTMLQHPVIRELHVDPAVIIKYQEAKKTNTVIYDDLFQ